jgi:DNA mismatch repair protein MutL
MSGVIKRLPDHIANQIAAGEVIQRPSSVVKELMENAIDAGATKVDVVIKDAGRKLIHILDNGKGMSMFDAEMCFERHATSKLHHADDLFNLQTKGFRGEALASIAAIGHVSLKTCLENEQVGTLIEIEGNQIKKNEPTVCPRGSAFEIKNLFYNVPARRNFLKSEGVEFKHIVQEFERLALPHFDVEFSLTHNGQTIHHLLPSNLRKRIVDLYGKGYNDKLVPVEEKTEIVDIEGFVGKPESSRKTRGEQFLFVNNRFFKDPYLNNAVQRAFEKLIQPNTHASYYIFLEIDPARIDVNVHPTKTEIKFEEERSIYSILLTSVKTGLGKHHITPSLDFDRETSFELPYAQREAQIRQPEIKVDTTYNPFKTTSRPAGSNIQPGFTKAITQAGFAEQKDEVHSWENFYAVEEEVENEPVELDIHIDSFDNANFIFSRNYMLTNTAAGILSIQYRRAYQRVIYDDVMESFMKQPVLSQVLLFPYEFEMKKEEEALWGENEKLLKQLGLDWEFSDSTMQLKAVPALLQEENINNLMDLLKEQITNEQIDKGELAHNFVLSLSFLACQQKNLIKSIDSARELLTNLFACEQKNYSPSGRNILKLITPEQLGD